MSAICGIVDFNEKQITDIEMTRLLESIQDWGPDAQYKWIHENIGLGQATLAITADEIFQEQPIKSQCLNFVLVGDCTIYNRKELCQKLGLNGQENDYSDAELILHSYIYWREDCFPEIVGDFSVAIWDDQNKELLCARDPMGIRPFFYTYEDNRFCFSSQIRSLQKNKQHFEWNISYLEDFIYRLGVPSDYSTPFKQIHRLPRGHYLKISKSKLELIRYWEIKTKPIHYKNEESYREHFLEIFKQSVQERMRSIGTVAVMMSGGLDSTSIYSIAKKTNETKGAVFPISCVFDIDKKADEREYIEAILQEFNEKEYEYIVSDDLWMLKNYPNYIPDSDEPNRTQLTYSMTGASYERAHQRGVKVVLTGYGGDEVLGFNPYYIADFLKEFDLINFIRESRALAKAYSTPLFPFIRQYGIEASKGDKNHILKDIHYENAQNRYLDELQIKKPGLRRYYQNISRAQAFGFHVNDISEPLGIETRYPFLDQRLIDFLYNIPVKYKVRKGLSKPILRDALYHIVPHKVLYRKDKTSTNKITYDGLKNEWNNIRKILKHPLLGDLGLIDSQKFFKQIELYMQGEINKGMEYYAVLALELWMRHYLLRRKRNV